MIIDINGISKTFRGGFQALDSVSLSFAKGEMVALIGASGSGKSTLPRQVSGLMSSDTTISHIRVGDKVVQQNGMIGRDVRAVRADVGFIFQQFNLVGRLPVLTNVLSGGLSRMPLWRSCIKQFTREEKALGLEALARVGIAEHAYKRASMLSGGQQQRAAIARTIVQKAQIILADEPIASLNQPHSRSCAAPTTKPTSWRLPTSRSMRQCIARIRSTVSKHASQPLRINCAMCGNHR